MVIHYKFIYRLYIINNHKILNKHELKNCIYFMSFETFFKYV